MKHEDALRIALYYLPKLAPVCEPGCCSAGGGVRRGKQDCHDIEIVCKPLLQAPRPEFGQKIKDAPKTLLDQVLHELEQEGSLTFKQGADRNRKYWINLEMFGMEPEQDFLLDLWMTMPPAQYGVNLVIRTGPGGRVDNFSKWIVTPRASGGALPDGYCVRECAVWRVEQIGERGNPIKGECPLEMPTEESFLDFLEITAEPAERHADWGKYTR